MDLSNLRPADGSKQSDNFRRGRGHGSGNGKTAGKGHKGQKARSGATRPGFEGGQMPLYRRIPKRGFTCRNSKTIVGINISELERFEDGATVSVETLIESGIVKNPRDGVKILGNGELTKKLTVQANAFSAKAAEKIPGVSILTTTNLSLCDGIHNTAQANVALGEKLAKQCAEVLNGAEEYQPPKLVTIERTDEAEQKAFQLEGSKIWLKLTFEHVKNCFLVYSAVGKDSGFTLTDQDGEVEILHIRGNRETKNHLYLELAREVADEAELSFAWQADPIKQPPVDEVTFLPVLSFYKKKITLK